MKIVNESKESFDYNWRKRNESLYAHWAKGKINNQIQLAFRNHWEISYSIEFPFTLMRAEYEKIVVDYFQGILARRKKLYSQHPCFVMNLMDGLSWYGGGIRKNGKKYFGGNTC